jgi:hypothetical protein
MAIRRGYKVLSPGRQSAIVKRGNGGLHYSVGKWVQPQSGCGPLAVFEDFQEAWLWADGWSSRNLHVYLCQFKPSRLVTLRRIVRGVLFRRRAGECPLGTVFASAVRTLE